MDRKEILSKVDHTLLAQTATWEEIQQICDDAVSYGTASVCIPPSYVKQAKDYLEGKVKICTVIGFPNGYHTTAVKEFETRDAIANGADEIDMVINLGWLRNKQFEQVEEEIRILKNACGDKLLKVIIETCLLTEEEKVKMCQIVTAAGADYIGVGAVFASQTKQQAIRITLQELKEICASVSIPAVAIGGIGPDNMAALKGGGMSGIAVVRALFKAQDIEQAARRIRAQAEMLVS